MTFTTSELHRPPTHASTLAQTNPRQHPCSGASQGTTTSHEIHAAWCGTRLRLILTGMFDPTADGVFPACTRHSGVGTPRP
jgi:hypothetical protein